MNKKFILALLVISAIPTTANAMHIAEGFLPVKWAIFYYVISAPFILLGIRKISRITAKNKDLKMLLGLVAAYCFVLSALKLPSVTGSSSHPTGTGFGAIVFGPLVMAVIGTLVLLFQALFLAHGGLTTLGANAFSMAIAGPLVSYLIYKTFKNKNKTLGVFLAAAIGDIVTYSVTSLQLALAFPAKNGGILTSFERFISVFGLTQIPLAIVEGILTVMIFNFIEKHSLSEMNFLKEEA